MDGFNLKILTPNKVVMDRKVNKIIVRTTEGDLGILKNHVNYVAAIKRGPIKIFFLDNSTQEANIKDGFVSVIDNNVIVMVLNYDKINKN